MKALVAILVLALAACSSPTAPLPGDLTGPQALALSGDELYIASTDTDELRVLELTADANQRTFVAAPNPIYVLSIPVVTQPVALAADDDGLGHQGPYVFALSAVARRLGIVSTDSKIEQAEVALPGTPLALAARSADGGGARVYLGLSLGNGQGAIATLDVPPPAQLDGGALAATIAYPLGRTAPAALAVSPDGSTLAIGDTLAGSDDGGVSGKLLLLSLGDGSVNRLDLGGPVGRVLYSPAASRIGSACTDNAGDESFPAGQFLYALVESTGCGAGQRCGGIQVIRLGSTPQKVLESPLQLPGVITDIAVGASTAENDSSGDIRLGQTICASPTLLLAAPSTNSAVYFADGVTGQVFNFASGEPSVSDAGFISLDGGTTDSSGGPNLDSSSLATGGLPDQTVSVVYQGLLPVLIDRAATLSGTNTLVDDSVDFAALGVQPGDALELPSGCVAGGAAVTSVQLGALQFTPAAAANCVPDGGTYSVRVAGAEPYLVAGSVSGYLGRVAPGGTFASTVPFAYPQSGSSGPALTFEMGAGLSTPVPGEGWSFAVSSGVAPLYTYAGDHAIQPGPAVWAPSLARFYVGYPGSSLGGQVSEISPTLVVPGKSNGVAEYQ